MLEPSAIFEFIRSASTPLNKREIARAFGIKGGEHRVALKQILKHLEQEGQIVKQPGGDYAVPQGLPAVAVIEVTEVDVDGDVLARAIDWNETAQGPAPRIEVQPGKKGHPALKPGDRALARFARIDQNVYAAHVIRTLEEDRSRVIGMVRLQKRGAVLVPTDKKARYDFDIAQDELNGAKDGDLAVAEVQPERGIRNKRVRIVEVLGREGDPKAISLISLYEAGLRTTFPPDVLKASEGLEVPHIKGREDLRGIPLVTIDGVDARDFDDAVFAEPYMLDGGQEGFHLIVAIADVAYYVRPNSPLDQEALKRGNSTYFPDRVLPMLPEALSNYLCSLRPEEDRACLAVHMWVDGRGKLLKYKFVRGLMRSAARLIYENVQAMFEAQEKSPVLPQINNLYAAFRVLDKARQERGALDLDMPERQILIDASGTMTGVKLRERVDAHKLIEEFMILANVAAASALEDKDAPCVYRIHDKPSMDKLDSVREFLGSFNLTLPKGKSIDSKQVNGLLRQAGKLPYSQLISTVILRTQSQAVYSPDNIGHYGLALAKYAHFTSPIRRYADLLVHRSLIKAYGLGPGGLSDEEEVQLSSISQSISSSERKSMEAERGATERFTAAYLSGHIGEEFGGTISGVTRFGLFITLAENGADGLIPMKSMSDDFYVHDEAAHALVGRRHGKVYRLGAEVRVQLMEADGLTGSTLLRLTGPSLRGADIPGMAVPRTAAQGFRPREKKPKEAHGPKKPFRGKDGSKGRHKPAR
jgi:ribonuclease R